MRMVFLTACSLWVSSWASAGDGKAGQYRLFNFPPADQLPLAEVAKGWVAAHSLCEIVPVLRQLSELLQQVNGYPLYVETIFADGKGYAWDKTGEVIQSRFLKSVVSEAFPEFKDVRVDPKARDERLTIKLYVDDRGEHRPRYAYIPDSIHIPLQQVKASNTSLIAIGKMDIRQNLGIAPSLRILHLYLNYNYLNPKCRPGVLSCVSGYSAKNILSKIGENWDYVIISEAFNRSDLLVESITKNEELKPQEFLLLSENPDILSSLPVQKPTLILNDSLGYMPYLHRLSDFTIDRGPVNFFESSLVGTPTLQILPNGIEMYGFDGGQIEILAEPEIRAGRMAQIRNLDQLISQMETLLRNPRTGLSDVEIELRFRPAFDRLLDILKEKILEQISEMTPKLKVKAKRQARKPKCEQVLSPSS